jgi:hypothetical protein
MKGIVREEIVRPVANAAASELGGKIGEKIGDWLHKKLEKEKTGGTFTEEESKKKQFKEEKLVEDSGLGDEKKE